MKEEDVYQKRLRRHHDELRWLYMELYGNDSMFAELCDEMRQYYLARNKELKDCDQRRESDRNWYKQNDMLGMMFYIDNFAGNMKGVESKLDYIKQCNTNYIHLMPFLDTPEGRSDGGYVGDSHSRGELYNADPVTGDARFCGTTSSMCGVEKAGF